MTFSIRRLARKQRSFRAARAALIGLPVLAITCGGRSNLELPDFQAGSASVDSGLDVVVVLPDAADAEVEPDAPIVVEPDAGVVPKGCIPVEETCNGRDDDCDGDVDEVPAIPCPGGGSRYCVAGVYSECPKRCETCIPGSERACQLSYCLYWGVQTCSADGRSFGTCREDSPPPECEKIAQEKKKSRELEQCCVDNGHCCLDLFDLDGDGDTKESIGQCDEVTCE